MPRVVLATEVATSRLPAVPGTSRGARVSLVQGLRLLTVRSFRIGAGLIFSGEAAVSVYSLLHH